MVNLVAQDDYTRITLRLPEELHAVLSDAAMKSRRSMNAEIIERLQASLNPLVAGALEDAEAQQARIDAALKRIDEITDSLLEKVGQADEMRARWSAQLEKSMAAGKKPLFLKSSDVKLSDAKPRKKR